MNVPARGKVRRATKESPGAIEGAIRSPLLLQPGTPSDQLSSSIPCQCTDVPSGIRLITAMSVGCPRVRTSNEPGFSIESAAGALPSRWRMKLIA